MSMRSAGQSEAVRAVTGGGYDSVRRLAERQVNAMYAATGQPDEEVFVPAPQFTVQRRAARATGLGRNVDSYA